MPPLDGPRAKVERAKSQLKALHRTSQALFEQHPYSGVKAEFDRKAGYYNVRAQGGPPALPDEWSVVIGEIAHDLRSAVDGLAWQLALLNTPEPYDRTAFPICRVGYGKRPRKGRPGKVHRTFWEKVKPAKGASPQFRPVKDVSGSIDEKFWTRIETFQPYKRRNGGRRSPLFLLEELNNTDKHRLITVMTVRIDGSTFTGFVGGDSKFPRGVRLYPYAVVARVRPLPPSGVPLADLRDGKLVVRVEHEVQVNYRITRAYTLATVATL